MFKLFKIKLEFESNQKGIYTINEETCTVDFLEMKLTRLIDQWYNNICTIDFNNFKSKYGRQCVNEIPDIFCLKEYIPDHYDSTNDLVLKCYLINTHLYMLNDIEERKYKFNGYIKRTFNIIITEVKL